MKRIEAQSDNPQTSSTMRNLWYHPFWGPGWITSIFNRKARAIGYGGALALLFHKILTLFARAAVAIFNAIRYRKPARRKIDAALRERLRSLTTVLAAEEPAEESLASALEATLAYARTASLEEIWLICTCILGCYPDKNTLEAFRRMLVLTPKEKQLGATHEFLRSSRAQDHGLTLREVQIVDAATALVDVTFCAKSTYNTGIQRVVRSIMPLWNASQKPAVLVRWEGEGYSTLDSYETQMVLDWPAEGDKPKPWASDNPTRPYQYRPLVIPWHSTVCLVEVPQRKACLQLMTLGEYSGIRICLLGYDTIPVGSADFFHPDEPERFARYLSLVKYSDVVTAISDSSAKEFASFVSGLGIQGLTGPRVLSIPLPNTLPMMAQRHKTSHSSDDISYSRRRKGSAQAPVDILRLEDPRPIVMCVGTHEPRKNQLAVLSAAETLLREGQVFRMVFVGSAGEDADAFDKSAARLVAEGYAVETLRYLEDKELLRLYEAARFSVFVSLHEGYGLPIVESLRHGTPVLTTNYGSMAELAAEGGCLTANPRDDKDIIDQMRRLLTDDALIERLKAEARDMPLRSWAGYADEVWQAFMPGASAHEGTANEETAHEEQTA